MNPAVAYAIQQGAVDQKNLGKPSVYDGTKEAKQSFRDWQDTMVTFLDASMPGIWEVREWIANDQPKTALDKDAVKLHFPDANPLLIDYADCNIYACLSSYTGSEPKALVKQARRPNGFEAWRKLHARFNPATVGRQRASLTRITSPPENDIREEIFGYLETTYQVSSTAMDLGAVIRKKGPCWICGGQHLAFECRKGGGKGRGSGAKGSGKFGEGKGRTTRQASLVAKARVVASPEDVVERVLAKASQQRLQRRLTAPFAESLVHDEGRVEPVFTTDDGLMLAVGYSVADVHKVLTSAASV
eukprot:s3150_g1.t1